MPATIAAMAAATQDADNTQYDFNEPVAHVGCGCNILPWAAAIIILSWVIFGKPKNLTGTLVEKNGTEFVFQDFNGESYILESDTMGSKNAGFATLNAANINDTLAIKSSRFCRPKNIIYKQDADYKKAMQKYAYTTRIRNLSARNTKQK